MARGCGPGDRSENRRRVRHPARPAGLLVVPAAPQARGPGGIECRLGQNGYRPICSGPARSREAAACEGGGPPHSDSPGGSRFDRLAAHASADRSISKGHIAGRTRQSGGPAAGIAALWRALGQSLARRGALRRGRLPQPRSDAPGLQSLSFRVSVPRLGDQSDERRYALRLVRQGAACRGPDGREIPREAAGGAGISGAGAVVL